MTSETKRLEHSIQDAKKLVDAGDALERLLRNRDFKQLIITGYLEKEAVRLVHLKADPSMATPERQASIVRDIDAIGAFSSYLNLVELQGNQARRSIPESEQMLAEMLAEEL